jgi:hypothetical protein
MPNARAAVVMIFIIAILGLFAFQQHANHLVVAKRVMVPR